MGSTRGSSLVPVLKAWKAGELGCDPVLIFSNREQAGILEKGIAAGINTEWLAVKGRDRSEYDLATTEVLRSHGVDFILLIGYMRILSSTFVDAWLGKIVNVHPSLLPKYGGMMDMQIHEAVLAAGDEETGCSVHIVNEEVDGGPIVIQKRCHVVPGESAETLKARVQKLEGESFLELLKAPGEYLDL